MIGNFVVEFLQIHPFQDGNGRLSRILTNLLLLQAGYVFVPFASHEKLIEDNKPDYYLSLRTSQKTFHTQHESVQPWMTFFLKIVLLQAQTAVGLLADTQIERTFSPKQLAVWRFLLTVPEATPMQISQHAHVARPTVNQVLSKLLALNMIERRGQGRGTWYRALISGGRA